MFDFVLFNFVLLEQKLIHNILNGLISKSVKFH